ncbi:hypothetical protein BBJ28_00009230 [Nothophytophthora sp. Chile5]|nr:hypothetical protein BBJ28_00009230 [Nothophytophthora sp. Chile5]
MVWSERASAEADAVDLELAERTPEPSPEPEPAPRMLPPFRRPRRPEAPPPPPPTAPAQAPSPSPAAAPLVTPNRRSLADLLPRRSLLAPETPRPLDSAFARGRDSDEHKDEDPDSRSRRKNRGRRKKRRSRILSELRPVEGPESAMPGVPAINDDDSQAEDDPLEAPDSGARAKEAFAAQRVRMRKSWCPDFWIYMKNGHPFLGICASHRYHPYKRGDRMLVLLVALCTFPDRCAACIFSMLLFA